jgi:ribosomal protein S18 acetylase RimI-like enzyme
MLTRIECAAADTPAIVELLERHAETSLFLLENLRSQGIASGGPVYVMARDGEEVVGVASVNAGGVLLVQAPVDAVSLAAMAAGARGIHGILGPTEQVSAILDGLALRAAPARMHSDERIYALDLRTFAPPALAADAHVRLATPANVDALATFRRAYLIEALGAADDAALDAPARADAERMSRDGVTFVLVARGEIVAMTAFTARHGSVVQVGSVFTPPPLRGRGHGRAVVAGSLVHARSEWSAERAALFTAEANTPAQRAYEALGFRRNGGYTLCFFREPQVLRLLRPAPSDT